MTRWTGTSGLIFCVAAERGHRIAHRGEIDHRGHAGEILHQDARRAILDLAGRSCALLPVDQRLDVVDGDGLAVLEAEQILEQHLHREGQLVDIAELGGGLGEGEIGVGLAADLERGAGAERVVAGGCHGCPRLKAGTLSRAGTARPLAAGSSRVRA